MANTLDDLKPKILAMALQRLRGRLVLPSLVNRDYSPDTATRGETVNVPVPPTVATREVAPGVNPVAAPDVTESTVPIALDQWHEAPIAFTDKDRLETIDTSVEMAVEAAADALAEKVNASVFARYYELYEFTGTAGTTPFASNYDQATASRKFLNQNKAPLANRRMVIDPDAEENAINLSSFADSSFTSQSSVILEGDIGRKLGYDWFMDQQVPTHTAGAWASDSPAPTVSTGSVGDTSIAVDTGAGADTDHMLKGDVFTIAGDSQNYVVTADADTDASGGATVSIDPSLQVAISSSKNITVVDTHVVNIAMQRDAFALAVRAFRDPASPADIMTMVDDVTGLPLRLEVTRQNKQDYWSLDLLWGVKVIRPELGVRVLG